MQMNRVAINKTLVIYTSVDSENKDPFYSGLLILLHPHYYKKSSKVLVVNNLVLLLRNYSYQKKIGKLSYN